MRPPQHKNSALPFQKYRNHGKSYLAGAAAGGWQLFRKTLLPRLAIAINRALRA
jgi:hypothetical protein